MRLQIVFSSLAVRDRSAMAIGTGILTEHSPGRNVRVAFNSDSIVSSGSAPGYWLNYDPPPHRRRRRPSCDMLRR